MSKRSHHGKKPWHLLVGVTMAFAMPGSTLVQAGDILRGGNTVTSAKRNATARSKAGSEEAALASANAKDRLARTTQAIQSVRKMQQAASGAGSNRSVPDGLRTGGLKVATGANALWTGASLPQQSGNTVNILQNQSQAMLHWETFNVGRNTTVNFDQSAGKADSSKWIAFNKIFDPSGAPSQILGSIKAQGQVYVLNQNGIIFGAGSQVNVRSLVASSLPINDNLISQGLLNNPDSQFLFTGLAIPAGAKGTPAFTPPTPLTANGRIGDVVVEKGAKINATANAENTGGRIMLVGPNVTNAGALSAPSGQVILAAGLQVGAVAHSADRGVTISDTNQLPRLRGLDVYVGSTGNYGGIASNSGLIETERGSVLMTGKGVQQLGAIDSSTSVSLNGRIDLLASYDAFANPNYDATKITSGTPFLYKSTGDIVLGPGSVTRIIPEITSTEKAVGTELALRSQINLQGQNISLEHDAAIFAPSADIVAQAGRWAFSSTESRFIQSGGKITLAKGALIDVAGTTDVNVPLLQNILTVQLRGAELSNSPLQRASILRAIELVIDARKSGTYNGFDWIGTPLGDATGFLGLIERTVAQLTTAGGSVKLLAGESISLNQGSVVDVSGGWMTYEGGKVKTTRVLYAGQLINIEDATPDRIYDGIYSDTSTQTSSKWSVTKKYAKSLAPSGEHYEPSYISGAAGGALVLESPDIALNGELLGQTVKGPRQVRTSATSSEAGADSTLSLAFRFQEASGANLTNFPSGLQVFFQNGQVGAGMGGAGTVALSSDLLRNFGSLSVENEAGAIFVPEGVDLTAAAGGALAFRAANITVGGNVSAPGGSLAFTALSFSTYDLAVIEASASPGTPPADPSRGNFNLLPGATLSAAGVIQDDRLVTSGPLVTFEPKGGSVTISAYSAHLAQGSLIDVSGGLSLGANGKRVYGDGGSLAIRTGKDITIPSVDGGTIFLGSTLKGYSATKGGSLALQAQYVRVGGGTTTPEDQTILVQPEFFNQGGFSSFALSGLGGVGLAAVEIAPGTIIEPVSKTAVAVPFSAGASGLTMRPELLAVGDRAPVSLSFEAVGVRNFLNTVKVRGDLIMGEGAVIRTDPLASVNLKGQTVAVFGSVYAPGGEISVAGAASSTGLFEDDNYARPTTYLSPQTVLSAKGATVLQSDPYGRRFGHVLDGGTINISGNIVAEAGSVLDVSGVRNTLDIVQYAGAISPQSGINQALYSLVVVSTPVDSSGGTITLKGGQEMFVDSTLLGGAGGPTALGGSLVVSSGRFYATGSSATPADINLVVKQAGSSLPSGFPAGQSAIGQLVRDANGNPVAQMGYFSADAFQNGGFDSLELNGVVRFRGPVAITALAQLSVASGGVLYADSAVHLTAPYVKLGIPFVGPVPVAEQTTPFESNGQPAYVIPTFGAGSLTVNARLIDVGTLSLQNIGQASLIADGGDIRGDGIFNMAGDLYLRAAQIYPNTGVSFTISAYDYQLGGVNQRGSVTVAGSGVAQLPLSAGGTLSVYASTINQGGVLRAPLGAINIGWDGTGTAPKNLLSGSNAPIAQNVNLLAGSVTSVSAIDPITNMGMLIPYGLNLNGTSWIDPSGLDITAGGVPQKTINIAGNNLSIAGSSVIDIRGGGDFYAYQWVSGQGGTRDILGSTGSFAILPGYSANFAPVGAFTTSTSATNLGGDPGYTNSNLKVGDKVRLVIDGVAGDFTLLPARYALLGGFLVTPKAGMPRGTMSMADGSILTAGQIYNSLNTSRQNLPTQLAQFEILTPEVIQSRAQYENYFGNISLRDGALALDATVPRLPVDAGHLIFQANQSMNFQGTILGQAGASGAHGGYVDISSASDILIVRPGVSGGAGVLTLDAAQLSSFGIESLLIGGIRQTTAAGMSVQVKTNNITVDNAGSPLSAPDIILVAKQGLTLAPNAEIIASGEVVGGAETLLIGDAATAGSGDGTLIRVSNDAGAQIVRSGVSSSTVPHMVIGAGATLAGGSLILDSTYGTILSPVANLLADAISLNSGQISLLFDNPGVVLPTAGLVLSGNALQDLQAARMLSLLSYSSIDIYGTGQFNAVGDLALRAAQIRGFNNGGGTVAFHVGGGLTLDNSPGRSALAVVSPMSGTLEFNAASLVLGANQLNVSQYQNLNLNTPGGILAQGTGGLATQGNLHAVASLITTGKSATQNITAGGSLTIDAAPGVSPVVSGGLGGSLTLKGASVNTTSDIVLKSGLLTLQATTGDVVVGGLLDVGGTAQSFYDVIKYTDAGQIKLVADLGSVNLTGDSVMNVSAHPGGGNAGTLAISTVQGGFTLDGALLGTGGNGGDNASFVLDVGALTSLGDLDAILNDANFTQSRTYRVRTGNVLVDGLAESHIYSVSADSGSILVSGVIDASGVTGGEISLRANGDVTLLAGSNLTVAAQRFTSAGKGGEVNLESGAQRNGVVGAGSVDVRAGSTIDLSVASKIAGGANVVGSSAYYGQFSGKLHIRAPQNAARSDLLVNPINGKIIGASSIVVEGYRLYDLTPTTGTSATITSANQTTIFNDGQAFLGAAGTTSANYTSMMNRLLANNAGLESIFVLTSGAEVINRAGDLILGTTSSTATSDWNLATYRFGAKSSAGVLTLRAAGNLTFYNALSDGFATAAYNAALLNQSSLLPVNTQSWSYRLTAGADLSAADFSQVRPLSALGATSGNIQIGKNNGTNVSNSNGTTNAPGDGALTSTALTNRYQVIRTGSGDIDVYAGRSVQFLNAFASIYTAGTKVADATMGGTFDVPVLNQTGGNITLGAIQQTPPYAVQYAMAGGNVSIIAQENIEHLTRSGTAMIADSTRQLPNNWLYRRGFVDPLTGEFGTSRGGIASTTWWVDYSNFFQSVGALGGGDVTMIAGQDISNVDAVIPTNARMAKGGTPSADKMLELGGGDLVVKAGRNLDAGVYYVERGHGTLTAGKDIITNSTRSPSLTNISAGNALDSKTWLPTTLFLGKGGFDVSARGDVLLGPVANAFLLPEGVNNTFWFKTYFSTYSPDSYVNVSSLGGSVTLRESATTPDGFTNPLLYNWIQKMQLLTTNPASASYYQPWLRLNETSVLPFAKIVSIMPGTIRATAFSGDINLVGNLTLSPSPTGTIDLFSAGAINGLQPSGAVNLVSGRTVTWGTSTINVSDANPAAIPGITSPYAYQSFLGANGTITAQARVTGTGFLTFIDNLFAETGATDSVLETKQNLHASGLLHANDPNPVRLYARGGNLSGLTLFSPKPVQIFSSQDITDIAFYIQNLSDSDSSIVSSGRDIIPYNANSLLRVAARSPGNLVNEDSDNLAGDIQISGPGSLQVLAGRNIDLGTGSNNVDGTGVGITSVGNARNPYLSFAGSDLFVGAGLGRPGGLADGSLNFDDFIAEFVEGPQGEAYLSELLGAEYTGGFAGLSKNEQNELALKVFYLVLRDSGRTRDYDLGYAAIDSLFGGLNGSGDILTRGRDIRTKNGGDIAIFAPGGELTLAKNTIGSPLAPPGIITESGGAISIFTHGDVDIGIGRIFTLKGGNEIIWSSTGDIAAGTSSKTVKSAPPTRVLIDPQSADVQTDLAGLATGGGIGVLATVKDVPPGDVDLIAPVGTVDAGDAGIRVSGNLNIAATQVLNASNISTGGTSSGVPAPAAPPSSNNAGQTAASNTASAAANAANDVAQQARNQAAPEELASNITVEVLGYGGDEEDEDEEKEKSQSDGQAATL